MYLIGIDIGGTNLKVGLIKDGEIINKIVQPTNSFDLIKQVVTTVKEILIQNNMDLQEIEGVGVGCPGIINNGVVVESANLKLFDCDLQKILEQELGKPVIIKNDADMATLAEFKYGAGIGTKNMILLTVGTGIGGGSIIEGKLMEGNGGAGEFGHITYVKNGIPCNCGRRGCIEKYVSAIALSNRAKEKKLTMENNIPIREDNEVYASDLVKAYEMGDKCAKVIIDEYVEDLSNMVLSLCNIFRPEKIIIGGGIAYAPKIISMVADTCKNNFYGYKNSPKVDIVSAKLGNDAGIIGVSACFPN